jgi:hypothetical protein
MNVRLESTRGIVHQGSTSGMTTCGVMYSDAVSAAHDVVGIFRIVGGTEVPDEIDCMACIAALPCDTITVHGTIRLPPISIVEFTWVIE